ncbi:acyltransferase [Flexivirga endophytica]|uniref:Acyltransferase n=1 Tax=Flexivirga endophytica TaxID=1849103 RepID=A0A916WP70_9MICO|nr:HAD-IB family hydrolase [Flexivirga endophytica]GGB16720.1 acyltransferase [Flexivirga endophytica]GHB38823.1 acyltransferase [Flexivirga endophytica]
MTTPKSALSQPVRTAIERIEAGPQGPQVGAFFDLDGTLVAGYTGTTFFGDQLRKREITPIDLLRSIVDVVDGEVLGGDPTKISQRFFASLRGQSEEAYVAAGERLFLRKIAGTIRAESRALVRAHLAAGHTVAVASAATLYQIAPIATELGIENLVCTRLAVENGVFTGETEGPMLWGRHKAAAVRAFAKEHGLELTRSYAYGNGYEDVAFLSSVGSPVALNPHRGLRAAAERLGWPILNLRDPAKGSLTSIARTAAALGGLNAAASTGMTIGLLSGDRQRGLNATTGLITGLPLAMAGVSLDVLDEERLWSHRPAVFVANHQSSLDPVVVGALLKRDFTVVAKKEARLDPRALAGSLLLDPVYIDRSNSAEARAALEPVVERIRSGTSLMIFPEGTRSATGALGRFKKGAFHLAVQAGVPIVPIVLRNTGELLGKHSFVLKPGRVDVAVLPPETDWTVKTMDRRITKLHKAFEQTLANWPRQED